MQKIILPLVVIAASGAYVSTRLEPAGMVKPPGANTQASSLATADANGAGPTPGAVAPDVGHLNDDRSARVSALIVGSTAPAGPMGAVQPMPPELRSDSTHTPGNSAIRGAVRMLEAPAPIPLPAPHRPRLQSSPLLTWVTNVAQSAGQYKDGNYQGSVANAYYGNVQVQADIQNGQLASVKVLQYPNDRNTSRYINSQAIPMLEQEAIQAQSGHVDVISGATLTSDAFIESLTAALDQARGSSSV